MMIVYKRQEGVATFTWEDVCWLVQFAGADLEEFIVIEEENESQRIDGRVEVLSRQ
jgi:hypothetical protein